MKLSLNGKNHIIGKLIKYISMVKKLTTTVPPKQGPSSKGLNVPGKQVKNVGLEKMNGSRQRTSKRS